MEVKRPSAPKIRIKHTPNCRHPYTATMKGVGFYGFGHTSREARESLHAQIDAETQLLKAVHEPSSAVTKIKETYRRATKGQRAMLRVWFARVLSGEDGKP